MDEYKGTVSGGCDEKNAEKMRMLCMYATEID